ncbi:iron permease [uncultured Helicobacter sp.]|uniref:iron permease n=1 Tax=uncultured Helicobacter sp. TaxID=175537 RepID=UPI00262F8499|nr:iron permease [uncultured Helicobacter sp.]
MENRTRSPYSYQVLNLSLLKHIALREKNALDFLILYIEKVLVDSGLMGVFDNFFCKQTEDSYAILKQTFTEVTIQHTKINKTLECGRIFTKVLNPLAYIRQKRGTERGHLSATLITQNDLRYNRENWRDQQSGKSKNIVRSDFEVLLSNHYGNYKIQKAKRIVREFNNLYRKSLSEVCEDNEKNPATQIHHIFPASTYPKIADFLENLIALTPNQHNLKAHPKNRTREIDRDFQYVCLLAKTHSIWENLVCNTKQEKIYDFDDYRYVLNIGFDTEEFNSIGEYDFLSLLDKIDKYYDVDNNKYHKLIELNYLGAN